jgi:ribosome-associated protein
MSDDISNSTNDLRVVGHISIPRDEVEIRASRSGGPGGQHVNTSSTRIEVRWNLDASRALTDEEKDRVRKKLGARVDSSGSIRVVSWESRSQARNREVGLERLAETVRRALAVQKKRRPTRRPKGANEERLREKKLRGARKKDRSVDAD